MKLILKFTFSALLGILLSCKKLEKESPTPKVAIAGLAIESSTFSPALTHEEAFRAKTGDAIFNYYPFT